MANVIQDLQKPTLVIAHNKTLAAQLTNEFREFFPNNAVEYFVSYYDYYQPEAYIKKTDTYIEKEAQINEEIDRLRHSATQSLLTRKDVIICASVSAIYGLGAPQLYRDKIIHFKKQKKIKREDLIQKLITIQFTRTNSDLNRGTFRLIGQVLEIMPVNEEFIYRVEFSGDQIVFILKLDRITKKNLAELSEFWLFPAKHFITDGPKKEKALKAIRQEMNNRIKYFEKKNLLLEAERIERRTKYDLEMLENLGYCSGIENYSRHLSGRKAGEAPDTLFSYFPKDFLMFIDESHVTVPQIRAMYQGDKARKENLIDYGFRLPSALDNRPLKFTEFEQKINQIVFVSATPGEYEFKKSSTIIEQIIRPTGLIDPQIIIKPIQPNTDKKYSGQIEDVIEMVKKIKKQNERVLITTLTKKMAEDLTEFLKDKEIKVTYIHSGVKTIDRLEILEKFRKADYDVLVGVNLLREGLDLPEVSLICILDADKEGFLRSTTSLIQTIGRAARNINGQVILYADHITKSMQQAIQETDRRRQKQITYNKEHNITPQTISKAVQNIKNVLGFSSKTEKDIQQIIKLELSVTDIKLKTLIKQKEKEMKKAALELDFELATILRDEIVVINKELKNRQKKKK